MADGLESGEELQLCRLLLPLVVLFESFKLFRLGELVMLCWLDDESEDMDDGDMVNMCFFCWSLKSKWFRLLLLCVVSSLSDNMSSLISEFESWAWDFSAFGERFVFSIELFLFSLNSMFK